MEKLSQRRKQLCLKFAKRALKSEKFSKWFKPSVPNMRTRTEKPKFCNVVSRTARSEKSPISYFTKLLNQHYEKKK